MPSWSAAAPPASPLPSPPVARSATIHFLRWLLGLRITRVLAQTANLHCGRIEGEDICQFQGELSNGGFVPLSVAWNSQGEHLALYGTPGSLVYLAGRSHRQIAPQSA